MGIGSITSSAGSMSVMQMTTTNGKDQKSKNIQKEITDAQQKMQKLSSKEELSANEKATEQKKLQKEISSLNTELKQHQDELLRSQKREEMLARLREEIAPAQEDPSEDRTEDPAKANEASQAATDPRNLPTDEQSSAKPGTIVTQTNDGTVILKESASPDKKPGIDAENKQADGTNKEETAAAEETSAADQDIDTDTSQSGKEMHAMVSADAFLQQAGRQDTIIAKTNDGIAILKGEIKLDAYRGTDTERKQDELEKLQKQEQRAQIFQFSILGDANQAMKTASENASAKNGTQDTGKPNAYISALNASQQTQAPHPEFQVAIS